MCAQGRGVTRGHNAPGAEKPQRCRKYFRAVHLRSSLTTLQLKQDGMHGPRRIHVAREGPKGPCPPKLKKYSIMFWEAFFILCFERRFFKQNSVIRLKSNISPPSNFWAGYATATKRRLNVLFAGFVTRPFASLILQLANASQLRTKGHER